MGSSRLPGKVMMSVCGRPMIAVLLERLGRAQRIDQIVLATSEHAVNDKLAAWAEQAGCAVFRGSETDVLDRYYQAACRHGADVVVRITGDCPLVDPALVDQVVARFLDNTVDYASNIEPPTYPNGLDTEVFSMAALTRAWREAREDSLREHVTLFLRRRDDVSRVNVEHGSDCSAARWTVDEPEDLAVVRAVFAHFFPRTDFTWREVLSLSEHQPQIFTANRQFRRNEGSQMSDADKRRRHAARAARPQAQAAGAVFGGVVIRTDASRLIGSGHLMRCLTLAAQIRARGGDVTFVCRKLDGHAAELVLERGFDLVPLPAPAAPFTPPAQPPHAAWLGVSWEEDAQQTRAALEHRGVPVDWLVVDHYALDQRWENALRDMAMHVLVIDDLADRDHAADVLLDQNLVHEFQTRYAARVPETCRQLLGPRYSLLQDEYRAARAHVQARHGRVARVLMYFGDADQNNVLGRSLAAWAALGPTDIQVDAVISPRSPHLATVRTQVQGLPGVTLHEGLPSLATLLAQADLALGAGGSTSWERLCLGVGTVVITLAANQEPIARALERNDLIKYLGRDGQVTTQDITAALAKLVGRPIDTSWSQRCLDIVDGRGAQRVVDTLCEIGAMPLVERPGARDAGGGR